MKYMILIPTYLWKNTFRRWFENPISPLSKILITILLSLLSLLILVTFSQSKIEWLNRLKTSNSYRIHFSEIIESGKAINSLSKTLLEIKLWEKQFGSDHVYTIIKPNIRANSNGSKLFPIIVYHRPFSNSPISTSDAPKAFLLNKDSSDTIGDSDVSISNKFLNVTHHPFPEELSNIIEEPQVVALPLEMIDSIIHIGYISHTVANFESIDQVKEFSKLTNAYYDAEGRQIEETSSLAILAEVEHFNHIQDLIRIGIVLCCGTILAIILGAIAWLEFNQELYLTALFQSFGVPAPLLLFHIVAENTVVIAVGIVSSLLLWKPIYLQLTGSIDYLSRLNSSSITIQKTDLHVILYFAIASLLLATAPIAYGLRKPPGLVLQ